MGKDYSKLKKPEPAMPGFVKKALKKQALMDTYKKRPAYQQNDYLGWIHDAKIQEEKEKRLHQMLDELQKGGIFMGMEFDESNKKEK